MSDHRSIFNIGQNCCAVAKAARATPLIDGEAYFHAFMRACEKAQRSITILAWDFNSKTRLSFAPDVAVPDTLGEFLNYLARRNRRLQINILDWDYPMVFGADREFSPLYGLSWTPHRRVHLRYDDTHPVGGSHHQKVVVIDDQLAFVGGLDLTCKRWDTPAHDPADSRRSADGKSYPPFHDLMIMVDGEAAAAVGELARRRWKAATGEKLRRVRIEGGDPWPENIPVEFSDINIGIACTAPSGEGKTEIRDVEQLYLDMIAAAKKHIYIENQYFTSNRIGDALAARLQEEGGPEIVLVTRLLSHGWLEEMTMHVLRTQLVKRLNEVDRDNRFSVYYPHIENLYEGTCIDMHSKMMCVDDQILRIGSSNISNRSMGLDSECDVALEALGDKAVSEKIRNFRHTLLAEHLDVEVEELARQEEARGTMRGAISVLQKEGRTLKDLDHLPEYSATVLKTAAVADMEKPVSLESLVEQFTPDAEEPGRKRSGMWLKASVAALVLIALTLAWRYTPLAELISTETVTQWGQDFSGLWWGPLVIILAYIPASLIMFPRPLITLAAVVAFGPKLGFVYALVGIIAAALAAYGAGRAFNRDTIRRIAGEKLNRLSIAMRERGLIAMTAIRIVPVAPFVVSSLVAGAIRIKIWQYVLGTMIGMMPGLLAATVFGNQLQAALHGDMNYWVVGGVIALMVGGVFAVRRWLMRITPSMSVAAN